MEHKKDIGNWLPILTFIISYFLFHLVDWVEATQFLLASIVATATYMLMVYDLKSEHKGKKWNYKPLNYFNGLLTVFTILIFAQSFVHWYRMISAFARTALLYGLIVIYIAILFRAIRVYAYHKMQLEQIKPKKK
jgi:hypothetical protein